MNNKTLKYNFKQALHPDVVAQTDNATLIEVLNDLRIEATWLEVNELKPNSPEREAAIELAISINVINQELKKRVKERINAKSNRT